MKHSFPTLYLFNNVFFPQTVIPLTVSDGVSKKVLLENFEQGQHVVFYHPNQRTKKVGTVGKVIHLEHNTDKSISVLVQGIVRVELLIQEQHLPYPVFQVGEYFDNNEGTIILDDSIERLHHVLSGWLNRHVTKKRERDRFIKEMNSPTRLINNLCMLVLKDVELKEIFLNNVSLADRIRLMNTVLQGENPETEDGMMSEAIKKFERLEIEDFSHEDAI